MANTTGDNLANLCGTAAYPVPCPIQRLIDGHGGSCKDKHFQIPVCNMYMTADNWNQNSSNWTGGRFLYAQPNEEYSTYQLQEFVNWSQLNRFYVENSTVAVINGVCLALGIITLLNILALTPSQRRVKGSYWALLLGTICAIVSSACAVQLSTVDVSPYPNLTNDWVSTTWSTGYKARTIAWQAGDLIGLIFLQVALYIQGKALLMWMKLRSASLYYGILAVLVLIGIVAWSWRLVWAMYRTRFLAFVPEGAYRPSYFSDWPGTYYVKWSSGFVEGSLGLWCIVILVSSVHTIICRNEVLFSEDGPVNRATKRRATYVKTAYEVAIRCIGFVSVQSFAVPILLIALSHVANTSARLQPLIQPVLFTLLPYSALFNQRRPDDLGTKQQNNVSDIRPTRARTAYQRYTNVPHESSTTLRTGVVELAEMSRNFPSAESKKRPLERTVDDELAEIDRMN